MNLLNSFLNNLRLFTFILESLMPVLYITGLVVLIATVLEYKKSLKLKNRLLQMEVDEYAGEVEAQHIMEEILKAEAGADEKEGEKEVVLEEKSSEEVIEQEVVEVSETEKKSFKFKKNK